LWEKVGYAETLTSAVTPSTRTIGVSISGAKLSQIKIIAIREYQRSPTIGNVPYFTLTKLGLPSVKALCEWSRLNLDQHRDWENT
jgi:hypothetical protein